MHSTLKIVNFLLQFLPQKRVEERQTNSWAYLSCI